MIGIPCSLIVRYFTSSAEQESRSRIALMPGKGTAFSMALVQKFSLHKHFSKVTSGQTLCS